MIKIFSTYKGYSIEINQRNQGDALSYYCIIPTNYGIPNVELNNSLLKCILFTHENVVDEYKNASKNSNTHYLDVQYKEYILRYYYSYDTNNLYPQRIITPNGTYIDDIPFDTTNFEETINHFITFVDSEND